MKNKQREEIIDVIEQMKSMGVNKVGPAHCPGEEASGMFGESFGKDLIVIAAGKKFEV